MMDEKNGIERRPGAPTYIEGRWPVTINYSDTDEVERRLRSLAREMRVSRSAMLRAIVAPGRPASLDDAEAMWSERLLERAPDGEVARVAAQVPAQRGVQEQDGRTGDTRT